MPDDARVEWWQEDRFNCYRLGRDVGEDRRGDQGRRTPGGRGVGDSRRLRRSGLRVFGTSIWEYIHAYLPEGHKDRTNDCHKRFGELFPYEVLDQITPFAGVEEALHDLKRRGVRLAVLSGLRLEATAVSHSSAC